jgi:polyhydroxybutyrate depolymerase
MPLDGGETKLPWGSRTTKPVAEYLAFWADRLGCKTEPRTVSDKDGVRTVEYPSKADGGPTLTALFIAGHGHAWPGGQASGLPESVLGPDAKKLNATDVIWEFFKKAK